MQIQITQIKEASQVLRAINHKLRREIYGYLLRHGKVCVTQLYKDLGLEQSVASSHLAILRKQGFVKTTREGRFVYYSANERRLKEVSELSQMLIEK
jgi:DNA-binding transcriptional ArsR family regulator